MIFKPGIRAAAAGAALVLPLWLGSCSLPAAPSQNGTTVQAGSVPDPRPLPAALPVTPSAGEASAASGPADDIPPGATQRSPASQAGANPDAAGPGTAGGGTAAVDGESGKLPVGPASGSTASGNSGDSGTGGGTTPAAKPAGGNAALPGQVPAGAPVYFVSLDDGGSTGVRFGCNDSLVAIFHSTSAAEEPLRASLGTLLGGGEPPDGLYNALDNSDLEYVSAYFDGTTVVVNLTGTLRPGGACDIPRVDAQLTHTAVSAVGASRAEIYVDGRRLADILSLR